MPTIKQSIDPREVSYGLLIEQGLRQSLSQKIDPKLIMANNILQLSSMELQQVIEQELAENPALEVPEDDPCENCDQPKTLCIDCPFRKQAVSADDLDLSIYELEQPIDFAADAEDGEGDFIANIRAEITLQDHLVELLHSVLSVRAVGDRRVYHLQHQRLRLPGRLGRGVRPRDGHGHRRGRGGARGDPDIRPARGRRARPAGMPAGSSWRRLQEDDQGNPIALAMVSDFWQEMLGGKIGRIARRLKVSAKDVFAAIEFVKKQLNPYPGNSFRPPYQNDGGDQGGVREARCDRAQDARRATRSRSWATISIS